MLKWDASASDGKLEAKRVIGKYIIKELRFRLDIVAIMLISDYMIGIFRLKAGIDQFSYGAGIINVIPLDQDKTSSYCFRVNGEASPVRRRAWGGQSVHRAD